MKTTKNTIKDMILRRFKADKMVESMTAYIEVNMELLKLSVRESLANAIMQVIQIVVLAVFGAMILLFVSLTIAFGLSLLFVHYGMDTQMSYFAGFGAVALLYLIAILIFVLLLKKPIKKVVEAQIEKTIQVKTIETLSQVHERIENQ